MPANLRVLILEDSREDAELIVHELRRSQFDPEWLRVDTESEYNAHLGWPPDIILADYNMPLLDAPRALDLLHELDLDIPFIVVSGAIGEDVAVAMMRRGAADYLLKDRLSRLGSAVRHALDERNLREEMVRAGQALRASELRFYSFMNNNPALAWIKDEAGRILYVNNSCESILGITAAECLGKSNDELWSADIANHLSSNDLAVLQRNETSRIFEDVRRRGAGTIHLLSFRFPFCEADGRRLLGVISIDISEQVRMQRALTTALASKEVLLKEVQHRVKNNLQIISSLLAMQAESLRDAASRKAFRESQERVDCMALLHDRLNKEDKPDQVDFREYVEALARDLLYAYGADPEWIRLQFDLEQIWLGIGQAIPCGLILNELLTNTLKYAFPGGRSGRIHIGLSLGKDNLVQLTVSDDGVGFPKGFDGKRAQSLGLRIVDILRRQLDGTVKTSVGVGGSGVAFSIIFPRATEDDQAGSQRRAGPRLREA